GPMIGMAVEPDPRQHSLFLGYHGPGGRRAIGKRNETQPRQTTKLTIRPGTTITFLIGFPSISSITLGSALAAASIAAASEPAGTLTLLRSLPLIEIGISI